MCVWVLFFVIIIIIIIMIIIIIIIWKNNIIVILIVFFCKMSLSLKICLIFFHFSRCAGRFESAHFSENTKNLKNAAPCDSSNSKT